MDITYKDIIAFEDLETLSRIYDKLQDICEKYKKVMKDSFDFSFDIDYEKLELTWTQDFTNLPDNDYTEGNTQPN